jgi:type II secretory pathway component PulJ
MPSRKTPIAARPEANEQRFRQALQELQQLDYFLKGTVLKRMMKCGRPQCACRSGPAKRHGPYFEWTYKVKGKTVNVKLSPQAAPLYKAASKQHRKLKIVLARLERLSKTALAHLAKLADKTD